MAFKKFKLERRVSNREIQGAGREMVIRWTIEKYVKSIPIEALKKLFNLVEINEVTAEQNMNNATSREEREYWEKWLQGCIAQEEEVFRLENIIEVSDDEAGE